ncbi:MAG: hypothetical protein H7Y06_13830 [Opitutaceae bacterium]|nr:hypothetical protein [Opitutaceae bacterium]
MNIQLFSHDPDYAAAAIQAGVNGIVVDWEFHSKEQRQAGFDTEINEGTSENLAIIRAATSAHVICRINNHPGTRRRELLLACELGADEVLLPMVRTAAEVIDCLDVLPSGRKLGILVETIDALALADRFSSLPLSRVYVGLNDLLIQRGSGHLFSPLIDGTLDRFRVTYSGPLSVAGVTLPEKGSPISSRLLLAELARLGCNYGVARRSFRRDISLDQLPAGVAAIQSEWQALRQRTVSQVKSDRRAFIIQVQSIIAQTRRPACAC